MSMTPALRKPWPRFENPDIITANWPLSQFQKEENQTLRVSQLRQIR